MTDLSRSLVVPFAVSAAVIIGISLKQVGYSEHSDSRLGWPGPRGQFDRKIIAMHSLPPHCPSGTQNQNSF